MSQTIQFSEVVVSFRFTNLTYSSNFAHEAWRTICLNLCEVAKIDPKEVLEHFKLVEVLKCLESIVQKADKPVCIFLDDVHLLKCGHLLSQMGRRTESVSVKEVTLMFNLHCFRALITCLSS